jgi:hypothetical protein
MRMTMRWACLGLILSSVALPLSQGHAAACYNAAEQNAEQLVRLHSQLMVITLSCRTTATGVPLPPLYGNFTNTNINTIKAAEQTLMQWHRAHGKGGAAQMDKIRTTFSNDFSQKLAKMSPTGFCAQYRDYVQTAAGFTPAQLQSTLQAMQGEYRSQITPCAAAKK